MYHRTGMLGELVPGGRLRPWCAREQYDEEQAHEIDADYPSNDGTMVEWRAYPASLVEYAINAS